MISGYRDPKTVRRYDHNRENVELNAINFLQYEDEAKKIDNSVAPRYI